LVDGPVVRGTVVEDKGYVFAGDKLIEINLDTSDLRTICMLPVLPDYTYGGISVVSVQNNKMHFVIFNMEVVEYVVDLTTGKIDTLD